MADDSKLDPITVDIFWHRLVSIVQEAEAVIKHTSFSSTVGEADDYAVVLLDAEGRLLARSPRGLPGFSGVMGRAARTLLHRFRPETLHPGDVLVTNDPWICAGHLPDVFLLQPIFHGGRIVAYAANIAHLSDLGGRISAEAVDLFEEGLQIPPSFLYRRGKINRDVLNFIQTNSRTPRQVVGDLQAQAAANRTAADRFTEALVEYGFRDVDTVSEYIQGRTERAMREVIGKLPDGTYCGEVWSDGYDDPLRVAVSVRIAGTEIEVDYTGTSEQISRGLNSPFSLTYAETVYALLCALAPWIPMTEGTLTPLRVTAPEGTVVNPRYPAPVLIRVAVIHNAHAAIFRALSPLVPKYISSARLAAHSGGIWGFRFRGTLTRVPSAYQRGGPAQVEGRFVQLYLSSGGLGATGARDGRSATCMPSNCANVPIEVMEHRAPVLFTCKELIPDSGGAGKYRGGLGQRIGVVVLSDEPIDFVPGTCDRMRHPPFGLHGGKPGAPGEMRIDGDPVHPRQTHRVHYGQYVEVCLPGGGGFGDPAERDPDRVAADEASGLIVNRSRGVD